MTTKEQTKTNTSPADAAEQAVQAAENDMPAKNRLRRLTPASHIQVAVRAMDAIINFDYSKFEREAGYKAQEPNEDQMCSIVELKSQLEQLRGEFGSVRTGGGNGKTIEARIESTAKIVKAMNPKLKGEDLIEAVKAAYAAAYNSSALVGYDDKINEIVNK